MSPESRVDLRVPREYRKAENRLKQKCEKEVDGCESFVNSTVLPTVPDAKAISAFHPRSRIRFVYILWYPKEGFAVETERASKVASMGSVVAA